MEGFMPNHGRALARLSVAAFLFSFPALANAQCYNGTGETYQAGMNANAAAYYSTAIGHNAQAVCENSIAIGHNALAAGSPGANTAVGNSAQVLGPNGTALGGWSTAAGNGSTALGTASYASGDFSTAVGVGARTEHERATAIGIGAETTRAYQMMFGNGANTYTLSGIASASSTAAQTGSNRYMITTDDAGNLAVAAIPMGGSATTVVDDLTTGGSTDALSAEQGRLLNERLSANETLTNDMVSHVLEIGEVADKASEDAAEALDTANQARDDIASVSTTADTALQTAWNAEVIATNAQTLASNAMQSTGATMSGELNMSDNRITNVGTPIAATDAATKGYVDNKLEGVNARLSDVQTQTRRNTDGIAIAIAMGGLSLPANKDVAIGANFGVFDGSHAFATQGAFKVNDNLIFNTGIGFALGSDTTVGGRMGLMAAW